MSAQPALKHMYLSVLAAAGLGGVISVVGNVLTIRNITDTLARHEKLLEKTATKAEMDKRLNEIQRTLNKKTRCFLA